jgi:hypothetical protein
MQKSGPALQEVCRSDVARESAHVAELAATLCHKKQRRINIDGDH